MPLTYWVDEDHHVLRSVGTDPLTAEDFRGYFVQTRSDPRVVATLHRIMDVRGVTSLPTTDEVRSLATMARDLAPAPGARLAIIAPSDLGFGVAMMFAGFAGLSDRLLVARDEAEAVRWVEKGQR